MSDERDVVRPVDTITTRELRPEDWREWRRIRLAALRTDPDAFGSRYEDWADADEARWRERLSTVAVTVVLERLGRAVGVVSLAIDNESAELISLWVAPEARGAGIGDAAVRYILARSAELNPGVPVTLAVKVGNRNARRLYARNGFTVVGPNPDDAGELLMSHAS